ncbi:YARHG domain-containing protein [Pedobacter namyangjuensis]|uniref:YARHG domain-containing protein n=1 Tax=Pedobacter namyangjuensis TaxID=600626 RepID=UPI000DE318D0
MAFSYFQEDKINKPANDLERKILKNLPFARRGNVFEDENLNSYYKQMECYITNPNYEPNVEILTENEKKWVEKRQ